MQVRAGLGEQLEGSLVGEGALEAIDEQRARSFHPAGRRLLGLARLRTITRSFSRCSCIAQRAAVAIASP